MTNTTTTPVTSQQSAQGEVASCCASHKDETEQRKSHTTENNEGTVRDVIDNAVLKTKLSFWKKTSGVLAAALIASLVLDWSSMPFFMSTPNHVAGTPVALAAEVIPEEGVRLPIEWNDLGKQMLDAGVLDAEKLEKLYESRGGMSDETRAFLNTRTDGELVMTRDNAQELLNLLWAFGLGNKNPMLEHGLMTSYDGVQATSSESARAKAGRMAATGGWPLSVGDPMDHYSAHEFVVLTPEQWQLVERIAVGIYRPCCDNPTHFPDCNHGMAMLGLVTLMVANNVDEQAIWDTALAVNAYWFPDTYMTIATYQQKESVAWKDAEPQEMLGASFSSSSGYRQILQAVEPVQTSGGGGCSA